VAFAQAFGAYASIGIEYGFHLSATRAVARNRDSTSKPANLVAGVMGVRLLLAACAVVIALIFESSIPLFRANPVLLWAPVFWLCFPRPVLRSLAYPRPWPQQKFS
jgi:PST family polysaccharide transporter